MGYPPLRLERYRAPGKRAPGWAILLGLGAVIMLLWCALILLGLAGPA